MIIFDNNSTDIEEIIDKHFSFLGHKQINKVSIIKNNKCTLVEIDFVQNS